MVGEASEAPTEAPARQYRLPPLWRSRSWRRPSSLRSRSSLQEPMVVEEAEVAVVAAAPTGEQTPVTLPALGESVTEGTVTRWLKAVGDDVAVDEPLLEVSTDKVDPRSHPVAGVLTAISVAEDETVEVGATLGLIGAAGQFRTRRGHAPSGRTRCACAISGRSRRNRTSDTRANTGNRTVCRQQQRVCQPNRPQSLRANRVSTSLVSRLLVQTVG